MSRIETHPSPGEQEGLAAAIGRGDGLTTDQSSNVIWPDPPDPAKTVSTAERLVAAEQTPFQQFLDCYVGTPVNPIDYETRLLRGHIALAMIAEYTSQVVGEAAPAKKKQYASTALGLIASAELGLRSASWEEYQYAELHAAAVARNSEKPAVTIPTPPPLPKPFTYSDNPSRTISNVRRVDDIITAAAFADTVAVRNAYGSVLSAAGDVASKLSPTSIAQDVAEQALNAFEGAIRYNNYAAANYAAAVLTIAPLSAATQRAYNASGKPGDVVNAIIAVNFKAMHPAWTSWDAVLSTACTALAASAGTSTQSTCVPTDDQITQQSIWPKLDPDSGKAS